MRIGELARRAGLGVSTLRAWERRYGLLQPARSAGRQRLYTEEELKRVVAVRHLLGAGLTLPAAIERISTADVPDTTEVPEGDPEAMRLRQIIEAAGDGIWVSYEGRTTFVNRRMAELMHCSTDELFARPTLDFIDAESLPHAVELGKQVLTGRRQRHEMQFRRPDGSTFLAEFSTSPMYDHAGQYLGAVGVVRDVTEHRAAERESQFRAALLDSIDQAVAAAAPDGTILYVNAAAERLFGWRASEVVGRNGLGVLPAPASKEEARQIHEKLLQGGHHVGRLRLRRRDGTEFVASMTSAPVFGEGEQLIGLMALFTDLTQSLGLQEDLRNRELQLEMVALLGIHALRRTPGAVGPEPDSLLSEALDAIRRVLSMEYAALMEFTPSKAELVVRVSSPPSEQRFTVPAGSRSLAGYTALARKVVLVTDARTDRRFDRCESDEASAPGAAIAAPVFSCDGVRAVLLAETSTARAFDRAAVHFVQGMANVLGAALQ